MRINITLIILFFILSQIFAESLHSEAIIIDHNCTDLNKIPKSWIMKARDNYRIAFGHKNHGGQIISGMLYLKGMDSSIYLWDDYGGQGDGQDPFLCIKDGIPKGTLSSLGTGDWLVKTGQLLKPNKDTINVVMWDWGEWMKIVTDVSVNTYLRQMDSIERKNKSVKFIYMTGYVDGSGENGKLNKNNNLVRDFCLANNKILYDFADLESYDPDGNYFLDKSCNEYLEYKGGNWAIEYCDRNPGVCDSCTCFQTPCINCKLKASAFWWMLARMAGWQGVSNIQPEFNLNTQELDFGDISSPESSELSFDISNTGNTYFRISAMNIEDNIDSLFKFTTEPVFPIIINSSSKKSFAIKFAPPEANGKYSASIKFTTDMDEYAMNLAANYTGGVEVDNSLSNDSKFEVFPNPANDKLSIKFSLTEPQFINISIINLNGISEQQFIRAQKFDTGYHVENINLDNLNSGVYLVRLQLGINVFTKKIIIMK